MSKWVWGFGAALMLSGLAMVIHFGLQPRPVRMIKPSYVESAEEAGYYVWKRMRNIIKNENQVVFGLQNSSVDQLELVQAVINAAGGEGKKFERRVRESRLVGDGWEDIASWEEIDSRKDLKGLILLFAKTISGVYLVPTVFSSGLVGENPIAKLELGLEKKILKISVVQFVLTPGDVEKIRPRCDSQATFGEKSVANLGCMIKRKSSSIFRKNMDRSKYVLAVDQTGEKDYLVYLHTPVK
jgi:hypothetical protein